MDQRHSSRSAFRRHVAALLHPPHDRRAFTLVELLVVIAIFAVLLALLIPALAKARTASLDSATRSNLRQSAALIALYANDHRGYPPVWSGSPTRPVHKNITLLWNSVLWYYAMSPGYLSASNISAVSTRMPIVDSSNIFLMTCTSYADLDYWTYTNRGGAAQLRVQRLDQVAFATRKVLLLDPAGPWVHLDRSTYSDLARSAQFDGSASARKFEEFKPGHSQGDGQEWNGDLRGVPHPRQDVMVGLHTINGVKGIDW